MTIDWDSVTLAGVRTRGLTVTSDYVDVTNDDDAGWRVLLSDPAVRSVESQVGGITKNDVLLADLMAANIASAPLEITLPSALATKGTLTGTFLISSYEQNGEHDGAVEFSATFMSTGVVTFTPASA
jgi:TP901-1 family phage major tail protein